MVTIDTKIVQIEESKGEEKTSKKDLPSKKNIMLGNDLVYNEIKDLHNAAVMEKLEKRLQKVQELKGVKHLSCSTFKYGSPLIENQ